jgi:hypothetical protein
LFNKSTTIANQAFAFKALNGVRPLNAIIEKLMLLWAE